MKPHNFKQVNVVLPKTQGPYTLLPVHRTPHGETWSCWRASLLERLAILMTGRVWVCTKTLNKPVQLQLLMAFNPFEEGSKELMDV